MPLQTYANALQAVARQWDFRAPFAGFALNGLGNFVGLALQDGRVHLVEASDLSADPNEEPQSFDVHEGSIACLCADADGGGFLTGGEDGKLFLTEPSIAAPTFICEPGKVVRQVAAKGPNKRAFAVGHKIFFINDDGVVDERTIDLDADVNSLAFSPDGSMLGAGSEKGLYLINVANRSVDHSQWKPVSSLYWYPDGKRLATGSVESSLSLLDDGFIMPVMMAFSAQNEYLVASGKDRIMLHAMGDGKKDLKLGAPDAGYVTQIAPHPTDRMIAAGYDNGMVVLAPIDGRAEIVVLPPLAPTGQVIMGLSWNKAGDCLFAATQSGHLFLFTQDSVKKLMRSR